MELTLSTTALFASVPLRLEVSYELGASWTHPLPGRGSSDKYAEPQDGTRAGLEGPARLPLTLPSPQLVSDPARYSFAYPKTPSVSRQQVSPAWTVTRQHQYIPEHWFSAF